jgi:CRISPR-associated exonuclease Cas4
MVHVEHAWAENLGTAEGRVLHHKVDSDPRLERRGDLLIARMLPLRSNALGLYGVADCVEFHRKEAKDQAGAKLPKVSGRWRPYPVEYKRGKLRKEPGYLVQLCAQALCLEEMLAVSVREGAIFFGQNRRRMEVAFDDALRDKTRAVAQELHTLIAEKRTPPAEHVRAKCEKCSLLSLCLPKHCGGSRSVSRYLQHALADEEKH